jgi:hypothetical protein
VVVDAVNDLIATANASDRLEGRIDKPYKHFPPVKGLDSAKYPLIEEVETSVQRLVELELDSQGGGTMPKVAVDPAAPPTVNGGLATVYAAGGYSPSAVMQSGTLQVNTGGSVPPIDSIISPSVIAGITSVAQSAGRYFSGTNAVANAMNSPQSAMGGPGLLGLTVIVPPSGDTSDVVTLPGRGTSEANPALLLVLGDSTTSVGFNQGGNTHSYGYFYTRWGGFDFAHGT